MRIQRRSALVITLLAAAACGLHDSGRVDSTALRSDAAGPRMAVTIIGNSADPRVQPAREAVAYWNRELLRLGRRFHLDSATVRADSIPDDLLRSASGEAVIGLGPATSRLRHSVANVPPGIVIALSHTDLISFSVRWQAGGHGVVGVRRADVWPLSLPNTTRNVIAHEVGHVLGLDHNRDSTTLMCGRPASCRPTAFVSDGPRFFPLTADDEQRLRERWP